MANELSELAPPAGSVKRRLRVGRGEGSGKGKTAGRGTKGQGARGSVRRGFEGGQMPLHRRLPKRGFHNPFSVKYTEVRLDAIASRFSPGDLVDVESLRACGLVSQVASGGVKVLGNGGIDFAVTVHASKFTASASSAIIAAGGVAEAV